MGGVGIKLNLSKCNIGQKEVKFLLHVVSREGYRPDPKNIEAIEKMKAPTTVKETRRFLGMCSFYRRHIENCNLVIIYILFFLLFSEVPLRPLRVSKHTRN